jgi:hypothetical protein
VCFCLLFACLLFVCLLVCLFVCLLIAALISIGEIVQSVPVRITARTVFSRFRLLPARGIHFGPLELFSSRIKKVELCNDGAFAFDFHLFGARDDKLQPSPTQFVTSFPLLPEGVLEEEERRRKEAEERDKKREKEKEKASKRSGALSPRKRVQDSARGEGKETKTGPCVFDCLACCLVSLVDFAILTPTPPTLPLPHTHARLTECSNFPCSCV